MPVKYNVVERGNPSNRAAPAKYYPSIQSSGRVTTREMAEMAADRSTLTTADLMAAIETFMAIVPQQLAKGNIVELGDFGSFWLKSTADGAISPDDAGPAQITSIMPRFIPGKMFKKAMKTLDFARGSVVQESEAEPA